MSESRQLADRRILGVRILGILNLTRDSYSDGGKFLSPDAAIVHARQMWRDGAALIDVGAESSHPDAEAVPAHEEIRRLAPVITALKSDGMVVSVDTSKPVVMRAAVELGADAINDITGFRQGAAVDAVRASNAELICMFNRTADEPSGRAQRSNLSSERLMEEIETYFSESIAELSAAGIARDRLILDPGMGFFLGAAAELSLTVLRELRGLTRFGLPLCVSPSRKSFLGAVLSDELGQRPVGQRAAATLAAELWSAEHGASLIRTHDVRPLADALRVWGAIKGAAQPDNRPRGA